jgi:ribonuclease-3
MLNQKTINEIETKLGVQFKNKALLEVAFTHSSYANLNETMHNERLEFLGDSVLHFVTTNYLYEHFTLPEGVLSKVRSYVVSAKNLAKAIQNLNLITYLQFGKNDAKNASNSIKANLYEAILASIYLDQGFDVAYNFTIKTLNYTKTLFEKLIQNSNDYKTMLQEVVQASRDNVLEYKLIKKQGPPHQPTFTVQVLLNNKVMSEANAGSKKEAENLAAKQALKKLQ